MHWYPVIKFLHVAAVIICLGGVFARQLVRRLMKRTDDIRAFSVLNQAAGRIESIMIIPGTNAILVFGIILALMSGLPMLGFLQGATRNWLLVSNVLLLGIAIIVPAVFLPRGRKFEPLLHDALAQNEITQELRAAMDDQVVRFAHLYEEVALVVITALMVLKPF
jgi:uncharacterized membrane protein